MYVLEGARLDHFLAGLRILFLLFMKSLLLHTRTEMKREKILFFLWPFIFFSHHNRGWTRDRGTKETTIESSWISFIESRGEKEGQRARKKSYNHNHIIKKEKMTSLPDIAKPNRIRNDDSAFNIVGEKNCCSSKEAIVYRCNGQENPTAASDGNI